MERVERQAKELEERLARLATSMPPSPQTAVIDETTQIHQGVRTGNVGNNSFPPGTAAMSAHVDSVPQISIPIPPRPKPIPWLLIGGLLVFVVIGAGVVGGYLLWPSSTPPAGPGASPTPAASPTAQASNTPELIEIPSGTFQMGSNDGHRRNGGTFRHRAKVLHGPHGSY